MATITKLQTERGVTTSQTEILKEAQNFYQNLYTKEDTDSQQQTIFLNKIDKALDENQRRSWEGPITDNELASAVKKLKLNKAPGPDGIPSEFYKHFWPHLKHDLLLLYNASYEANRLPPSQHSSLLKLLFKKGERSLLKNWRPISLLNTDYKFLAMVLAERLKQVLTFVIDEDQTCGIPTRSIHENLLRLRDTSYSATRKSNDLILINLDQEKAFDRVNRAFLNRVMDRMNFGPSFRHWFKIMYEGATSTVTNNGYLSGPVHLHRGLRQGCHYPPYCTLW
jgi:hypothetical protein